VTANSVTLNGKALISATALGTTETDPVANTNLTFSYVFGGGGGSHAGYGISPTSGTEVTGHTSAEPYPPIKVYDAANKQINNNGNYAQPRTYGLAGGLAHPPSTAGFPETKPQLGGRGGGLIRMNLKGALVVGKDASVDADGGQVSFVDIFDVLRQNSNTPKKK
jgi:hypothetical protein